MRHKNNRKSEEIIHRFCSLKSRLKYGDNIIIFNNCQRRNKLKKLRRDLEFIYKNWENRALNLSKLSKKVLFNHKLVIDSFRSLKTKQSANNDKSSGRLETFI